MGRHLFLSTFSFALCFAIWGLIAAFASVFRDSYGLSGYQVGLLVAIPVILGALLRIPVGILSDRWGGRWVFVGLMACVSGVVFSVPLATSFNALLVIAFFLGIAGSSFAVGVAYLLPWAPPERQGSTLGVYGLGNAGHSAAVFLGPLIAVVTGWESVFLRCWSASRNVDGDICRNVEGCP